MLSKVCAWSYTANTEYAQLAICINSAGEPVRMPLQHDVYSLHYAFNHAVKLLLAPRYVSFFVKSNQGEASVTVPINIRLSHGIKAGIIRRHPSVRHRH